MKFGAFLRGINVGGKNKVAMADLRAMAMDLGFSGVQTLLQSGNLLFEADGRTEQELEALLEAKSQEWFGFGVEFHVRSIDHLRQLVAENPFQQEAIADPGHLLVAFYKSPPAASACEKLRQAIRGRERFVERGREAYIVYPDGVGESKLTNALMDSKLGLRGTARNWNTILRLLDLG